MAKRNPPQATEQGYEMLQGEALAEIDRFEGMRLAKVGQAHNVEFIGAQFHPYENSMRVTCKFALEDQPEARVGQSRVWRYCKAAFPTLYNERTWIDIVGSTKYWYVSWFINMSVKPLASVEGNLPF